MAKPGKKNNILAAFTASLGEKQPPASVSSIPAPTTPASVTAPPTRIQPPQFESETRVETTDSRAAPEKQQKPQKQGTDGLAVPKPVELPEKGGFQRITVSMTSTDLEIADSKLFELSVKNKVILDRSKLLKVALRALDPEDPEVGKLIQEVIGADLRKVRK